MNNTILLTILAVLAPILSAILGAYGTVYFQQKQKDKYNNKLRAIAIKAVNIFRKYSKNDYDYAKNDFNSSLNITEKRIVLVLLHKLGIPIVSGIENAFDIKNVEFTKSIKIDSEELDNIIEQIKTGNCDKLFFIDPDEYFINISRIHYKRNLAIKFMQEVFSKSRINLKENIIEYSDKLSKYFSPGEINMLQVFKTKIQDILFFDTHKDLSCPIHDKIDKTIQEIKIGIWDTYLEWNYESYSSIVNQGYLANRIVDNISQSLPKIASS